MGQHWLLREWRRRGRWEGRAPTGSRDRKKNQPKVENKKLNWMENTREIIATNFHAKIHNNEWKIQMEEASFIPLCYVRFAYRKKISCAVKKDLKNVYPYFREWFAKLCLDFYFCLEFFFLCRLYVYYSYWPRIRISIRNESCDGVTLCNLSGFFFEICSKSFIWS